MHVRTQEAGEDAVVLAMRTSMSKVITKNGQQRLRSAYRPLGNSLAGVGLVTETDLQGIGCGG